MSLIRSAVPARTLLYLLCLTAAYQPLSAFAAKPSARKRDSDKQAFVRVERDKRGKSLALQTAVVSYGGSNDAGQSIQVDLVGAIHVADKAYYDLLNRTFVEYDTVLYELVAPPGTKVDKDRPREANAVNLIQNGMKNMLQLEHQLEQVDYAPLNFVHADMSPNELAKAMQARNENLWTIMLRAMQTGVNKAAAEPAVEYNDLDLLAALFDPKGAVVLKKALAEQFQDLDTVTAVFEGPQGSSIITDRNAVALRVLKEQMADGKRRIAIFYGAAHMPDMAKHLIADFGLKRTGERWLTAWNLK